MPREPSGLFSGETIGQRVQSHLQAAEYLSKILGTSPSSSGAMVVNVEAMNSEIELLRNFFSEPTAKHFEKFGTNPKFGIANYDQAKIDVVHRILRNLGVAVELSPDQSKKLQVEILLKEIEANRSVAEKADRFLKKAETGINHNSERVNAELAKFQSESSKAAFRKNKSSKRKPLPGGKAIGEYEIVEKKGKRVARIFLNTAKMGTQIAEFVIGKKTGKEMQKHKHSSPIELFRALQTASPAYDVGVTLQAFLSAIVLSSEFEMLLDSENHQLNRKEWKELLQNSALYKSLFPFGMVQLWGHWEGRHALTKGLQRRLGLADKTFSWLSPQSKWSNMALSGAKLSMLVFVSSLIFHYGNAFRSCRIYQESLQIPTSSIANPRGGRIGMSEMDKQKHKQICAQGWINWAEEGIVTFGPVLLASFFVGALMGPTVSGLAATSASMSRALKGRVNSLKALRAAKPNAAITAANVNNGKRVIDGFRLIRAGSAGRLILATLSGGVITAIVLTVVLIVFELAIRPLTYLFKKTTLLSRSKSGKAKVESELKKLREVLRNKTNRCEKSDNKCSSEMLKVIDGFHNASKNWRHFLVADVLSGQQMWLEKMTKFRHRYRASKTFYYDIVEQIEKVLQGGRNNAVEQARKLYDAEQKKIEERFGKSYRPRERQYYEKLATISAFSNDQIAPKLPPLFRSTPVFGVGFPIPIEPREHYVNDRERKAFVEHQKKAKERKEKMRKVTDEVLGRLVERVKKEDSKKGEQLEQLISEEKKRVAKIRGQVKSKMIKKTLDRTRQLLTARIKKVGSDDRGMVWLKKLLSDPNDQVALAQAILFLNDTEAHRPCPKGTHCYRKPIKRSLGYPETFMPGEKYVLYDNDHKLKTFGKIDVNYADPEFHGNVRGMSDFLLKSAVCGPNVSSEDGMVETPYGEVASFNPPAMVAGSASYVCSRSGFSIAKDPFFFRTRGEKMKQSLPLYLYDHIEDDLKSTKGFEAWWSENVEPLAERAAKEAERLYKKNVITKLLNPKRPESSLLYQKGRYTSWITSGKMPAGVSETIRQEISFYFENVILPMAEDIEFANRIRAVDSSKGVPVSHHVYDADPKYFIDQKYQKFMASYDTLVEASISSSEETKKKKEGAIKSMSEILTDLGVAFQHVVTDEPGDPQTGTKGLAFSRLYFNLEGEKENIGQVAGAAIEKVLAVANELQLYQASVSLMDATKITGDD